ncbi:hypothetical protein HBI56_093450 [Parastagonospora nodorum]|nr:hypothetical protein HBH53_140450 [Parastagonospora nodorum]KAH3966236.1 hypothetical protein HBH51_144920 [Parastagonospora nodorum]KAH3989918.1 hypothetical protein HBH52_019910 [Parastagonospora nodorum]KAH3998122.1 hypothetical protein HBI10_132780 [Parastagonospora nodorum]KAH4029940.1 hypothetical protein HBI13_034820 [Parastagonospora nodorum]
MLIDNLVRRASCYKAHTALSRLAALRRRQHNGVANITQDWKRSQSSKSNQLQPDYEKEQHIDTLSFDAQRLDLAPTKPSGIIQDTTISKLLSERKLSVNDLAENKSNDWTTFDTGNLEAKLASADQDNIATHSMITQPRPMSWAPQAVALEARSERCQLKHHDIASNVQLHYQSGSLATSKPRYFKVVAPAGSRSLQLIRVTSFTEALITIRFGDPGTLYYDSVIAGFWQRCEHESHSRTGWRLDEHGSYYTDLLLFIHGYNHLQNMEKGHRPKDDPRLIAITQAFKLLYAPPTCQVFKDRYSTSLQTLIGGGGTAHSYGRVLERFGVWHYGKADLKALPGPVSTPSQSVGSETKEPMQESQLGRPDEGKTDGDVVPDPGLEPQSSSEIGELMQESQSSPPDKGDNDDGAVLKKGLRSGLAAAFPDLPTHIVHAINTQNISMKSDIMTYSQSSSSRTTIIHALIFVRKVKHRYLRQIEGNVQACTGRPRRIKELRYKARQHRKRLDRVDDLMQTLLALEKPDSPRLGQDGLSKSPVSLSTPLNRLSRPFRTSVKSLRHRITSWESLPTAAKDDFDQGHLFNLQKLKTLSTTLGPDQRAFVWSQVIRQLEAEVALRTRTGPQSAAQAYNRFLKRIRAWFKTMKSQKNFPHDLLVPGKLPMPNRFTGKVHATKGEEQKAVDLLQSTQRATIKAINRKIMRLNDVGKWDSKETKSRQLSQDLLTARVKTRAIRKWLTEAKSTSDNRTTDPQPASVDISLPYEILHYVFEDALYQLKRAMFHLGRREFPQVMADNKWYSAENVSIMDFILILRQDPDIQRRLDFCADEVRSVRILRNAHAHENADFNASQAEALLSDLSIVLHALSFEGAIPEIEKYRMLLAEYAESVKPSMARAQESVETLLSQVDAEQIARKAELEAAAAESRTQLESISSEKDALSQHADRQRLLLATNLAMRRRNIMLRYARNLQTHTVEMQIQRLLSSLPTPQAGLLAQKFHEAYSKPAANGSRDDDSSKRLPFRLDGNGEQKDKHGSSVSGHKILVKCGDNSASPHILHFDVRNGLKAFQGTSTTCDAKPSFDRSEGQTGQQEASDTRYGKSNERDDDSVSASFQHFHVDEPDDKNPTDSRLNEYHGQQTDVIRGSSDMARAEPPTSGSGHANTYDSEQRPQMLSSKSDGLSNPKVVYNPADKGLSHPKALYTPAGNGLYHPKAVHTPERRRPVSRAEGEWKGSISRLSRHAASPNRKRVAPAPEMLKEQVFRIQRREDDGKIREVDWNSLYQNEDRTETLSHTMSALPPAIKHSLPETKPDQEMSTSYRPNNGKTRKTGGRSASNHDSSTVIWQRMERVKDAQVDDPPDKTKHKGSDSSRRKGNRKIVTTGQGNGQGVPHPLPQRSPRGDENKVSRTSERQDPEKKSATGRRRALSHDSQTTKSVLIRKTGSRGIILRNTSKSRAFRSFRSPPRLDT